MECILANDIVKGVCSALNECFDITVYTERVEQGLKLPCFFVYCNDLKRRRYRGERYLAQNEICIQYVPDDTARLNDEITKTTEKLFLYTEYIRVSCGEGETVLNGTKARAEKGDGYINFYVNYDMFYSKSEETELMEVLTIINEGSETA